MPIIQGGSKWDAEQDSSMNLDDMRAVINRICTEVPGMANPPDLMPAPFKTLSLVLRDQAGGTIVLAKGIHQANELHYNIRCKVAGGDSEFHVFLAQGTRVNVKTGGLVATPLRTKNGTAGQYALVPLFQYKNTGLTWQLHQASPLLQWPAMFVKNGYAGRVRSQSFSTGNSSAIGSRGPFKHETHLGPD